MLITRACTHRKKTFSIVLFYGCFSLVLDFILYLFFCFHF